MDIRAYLHLEYRNLNKERERLVHNLKKLPKEELLFDKNGKYYKWRVKPAREEETDQIVTGSVQYAKHYFLSKSKDRERAHKLALRRYYAERLSVIDRRLEIIKAFFFFFHAMTEYPDTLYEPCEDFGQDRTFFGQETR